MREAVSAEFPLALNTGRLRDQWHGMSRTGRVAQLFNHVTEAEIALHPGDLAAAGLEDGHRARVPASPAIPVWRNPRRVEPTRSKSPAAGLKRSIKVGSVRGAGFTADCGSTGGMVERVVKRMFLSGIGTP